MLDRVREMPGGIRLFLVYALGILFLIGASLRFIVDQAISAPVSLPGLVVMVLLAYTIFTTTLVIQRKQAARRLALGLASLRYVRTSGRSSPRNSRIDKAAMKIASMASH